VLFLDELPEFPRRVLEVLREPLESGEIMISRVQAQTRFPAAFQMIAAMNPCPCGYKGSQRCRCTPDQICRYRDRISGPLLDRIDLQVEVPALPGDRLVDGKPDGDHSADIRNRVMAARKRQLSRSGTINARLSSREITDFCALDQAQKTLLNRAVEQLGLSPRAFHRILKVTRTIADLDNSAAITMDHLTEALGYRLKFNH
jgi:magnesium chelatase family protein